MTNSYARMQLSRRALPEALTCPTVLQLLAVLIGVGLSPRPRRRSQRPSRAKCTAQEHHQLRDVQVTDRRVEMPLPDSVEGLSPKPASAAMALNLSIPLGLQRGDTRRFIGHAQPDPAG